MHCSMENIQFTLSSANFVILNDDFHVQQCCPLNLIRIMLRGYCFLANTLLFGVCEDFRILKLVLELF